jgi:hypothetical protein
MTYLLEITEYIYLFGVSLMTKCAIDVKGDSRCISERKRARRVGWASPNLTYLEVGLPLLTGRYGVH